eukprot:m.439049 g.439049  ORF g.439049 m.439049 type:complete len:220 (+) comp18326_c0_seq1:126-785(+)
MSLVEPSAAVLNRALAQYGFRDKVWKAVQYWSRVMYGLAAIRVANASAVGDTTSEALLKATYTQWHKLFAAVQVSRRTFRWGAALGGVVALQSGTIPWGEKYRPHFVSSKVLSMTFACLDHLKMLQVLGWASGDSSLTTARSFKALTAAYFFELMCQLQRGELRRSLYCALACVSNGHISGTFKTNDIICGLCGFITAVMDMYDQWPREKTQPKDNEKR